MNAITLMGSLLTSSDAKARLAFVGRLLYPLLSVTAASQTSSWSQLLCAPASDGQMISFIPLHAHFTVSDWPIVPALLKANGTDAIQIEACGLIDDVGDHDALVVLLHERPVVTVYAFSETGLTVQVGGFENSGIVHDGQLMALSRSASSANSEEQAQQNRRGRRRDTAAAVRAQQSRMRKARARLRKLRADSAVSVPMPRVVIRTIGALGNSRSNELQPVLYRNRPPRLDENGLARTGPAQIHSLAKLVRTALGVSVLQTSHALRFLGFTKTGADDQIANELAGGALGVTGLLAIGRANISHWTGFDSEEELVRFSGSKYRMLVNAGFATPMPDRHSRARAELANIKPLSQTYSRARNILRAFDEAPNSSKPLAQLEIARAFAGVGAIFSASDLIQLAMNADINPIPLWPSHSEVTAEMFELLRFLGRLQRGANAVLLTGHFHIVREAFAKEAAERTLSEIVAVEVLQQFYQTELILDALKFVEASGDALIITRRTRHITVGNAVPRSDVHATVSD